MGRGWSLAGPRMAVRGVVRPSEEAAEALEAFVALRALTEEPGLLSSRLVERSRPSGALLLSAADFDAFLEPVPASLGARPPAGSRLAAGDHRRVLRERIESWAKGVVPRLADLGFLPEVVVPDELEQHLSSRAPRAIAQRVVFVRDAFARSEVPRTEPELDPLASHAYLALTIDSVHVEVCLELCPDAEADVKNLRARLADPTALLELLTLFETLPAEFSIGVIGVPSFPRASSASADEIRALLDDSHRSRRPLWIGWSVKREIALAHAPALDEQLADALVVLAQVYRLLAWAPDNDLIRARGRGVWRAARPREELRERARDERRARKQHRGARKGPVRVEGSRREREDTRRPPTATDREGPLSRRPTEGDEGRSSDDRAARETSAAPLGRRPILKTTLRARRARSALAAQEPGGPVEKGARVRVLEGPFANKTGIVEELDGKGRARVRLGLLAATLDLKDLVTQAEEARPLLTSSHRRVRKR